MEHFFFNYLYSLAEFWSFVFRLGFPQILLIVLVIWWIKRRRCGQGSDDGCCGIWGFGPRGCCRQAPFYDTCCYRRAGCREEADEEVDEAADEADQAADETVEDDD